MPVPMMQEADLSDSVNRHSDKIGTAEDGRANYNNDNVDDDTEQPVEDNDMNKKPTNK